MLTRLHPAAEAYPADAARLPLPDASVDAVVVGQAWHWFPHNAAVAEVRRVLRPDRRRDARQAQVVRTRIGALARYAAMFSTTSP